MLINVMRIFFVSNNFWHGVSKTIKHARCKNYINILCM